MRKFIVENFRKKLAWKMLLIYVTLVLIPSVLLGVNCFSTVNRYLVDEENNLLQGSLNQFCSDIDADFRSAEMVYNQVQQHSNFLRFLLGEYSSKGSQVSAYVAEFNTMFLYSFLSSRFIEDVNVYMLNDTLLEMGDYLNHIEDIGDYSLDEKTARGYWRYDIEKHCAYYRKTIKTASANTSLGILEVKCTDAMIFEPLRKLQGAERKVLLQYADQYVDLNSQPALPAKNAIEVMGGMARIPIAVRLESTSTSVNNNITVSLLITLICFITLSFILFFVVYRLSRRITVFSQSMANYLTDSPKAFVDNGQDELSLLIKTYNHIVENNDFLLSQVKIQKLHQQETEYRALQSQIDPHFIYNSLEGIRMMAEMKDATDISDVVFSLSKLMRYSFSVSENEVTITRELDYVRQYINVQRMRIGQRVGLEIRCDSGCGLYKCPKFSIQPMVENAIKYGFGQGIGAIVITIQVELAGELLHISVSNTGQQIPKEKCSGINKLLRAGLPLTPYSSGNGIGLDNVNNRMRYLHKNSFSMELKNTDSGVSIELVWNTEDI